MVMDRESRLAIAGYIATFTAVVIVVVGAVVGNDALIATGTALLIGTQVPSPVVEPTEVPAGEPPDVG